MTLTAEEKKLDNIIDTDIEFEDNSGSIVLGTLYADGQVIMEDGTSFFINISEYMEWKLGKQQHVNAGPYTVSD